MTDDNPDREWTAADGHRRMADEPCDQPCPACLADVAVVPSQADLLAALARVQNATEADTAETQGQIQKVLGDPVVMALVLRGDPIYGSVEGMPPILGAHVMTYFHLGLAVGLSVRRGR